MMAREPSRQSRKRAIAVIVAAVILLHVAGLILFHADPVGRPARDQAVSGVTLASPDTGEDGSQALREYAILRDTTPLYLPTRWNAGYETRIGALARRPGDVFPAYSPELSLENVEIGEPRTAEPPPTPMDAVLHFDFTPFRAFRGAPPSSIPELPQRTVYFQVVSAKTGQVVFSVERRDPLPAENQLWAPAVFGVHITELGVAGPPILLASSGIEEVDTSLSARIRENIFTARLPGPGYYRVIAGP